MGAEQIVNKLQQTEILLAQGKVIGAACKQAVTKEQRYCRWRKEHGGMSLNQTKKL